MVLALFEVHLLSAFSLEMLHALYTLGACLPLYKVSQKIYKRNLEMSWNFYKKDIKYALTEDWNLLLLECFRKVLITHSFCK